MNIRKKTISSRVIAFVTAAIFILYAIPSVFYRNADAAGNNRSSASDTNSVTFPENTVAGSEASSLLHTDKLEDNGNGTFTFKSELSASYSFSDKSQTRARTEDGYFEITKTGSYLVELWGGNGGTGSKLPAVNYKPGAGGAGGFVYGILNVSQDMVGKKLYYEVGSNGKSITRSIDDGGSGGVGGGAGDVTLISVGAGGGYSAIYLIDDGDLENGIIKESSKDDPSKVLMIAGGGGGGGAGSNLLPVPVGTPDGGDGGTLGSLEGKASVPVTIGNTKKVFDGKYYAGTDGSSSGKKTTYTGKGGTDIPGEVNESVLGWFDASSYPNDWLKTYHPENDRGAGGAGNLRGGGGGAGFAGGSGGLQKTAVDAECVGGGGGGSSYISEKMTAWSKSNTGAVAQYFTDENKNAENGGSVIIRYIPTGSNTYEYLNNPVKIEGSVSDYFDIVDWKPKDERMTVDQDYDTFSVTDSVKPFTGGLVLGEPNEKTEYSLVLRPKSDFAGGNDVPVFKKAVSCTSVSASSITSKINYDDKVTHVNVPFKYVIKTNSLIKKEGEKYEAKELLKSAEYKKNDFITDIEGPVIKDFVCYTDTGTYVYQAEMTVVPVPQKDGSNSVGTPNADPTVITASAVVQVVKEVPLSVDGFSVTANKNLSYNDGYYDLSVDMKIKTKDEFNKSFYIYDPVNPVLDKNSDGKTIPYKDFSYTAPDSNSNNRKIQTVTLEPGYYCIQVYGGNGGDGSGKLANGAGGKGGYIKGYIKIEAKDEISIVVGSSGSKGANAGLSWWNQNEGLGGERTTVKLGGQYLAVAGGGGGGGAYNNLQIGKPGAAADTVINELSNDEKSDLDINLQRSSSDNNNLYFDGASGNGSAGGAAGKNYINKTLVSESLSVDGVNSTVSSFSRQTDGNGAVRITKLEVYGGYESDDGSTNVIESNISSLQQRESVLKTLHPDALKSCLTNLTLSENFSEYFDVEQAEVISGETKMESGVTKSGSQIQISISLPETAIIGPVTSSTYNPVDNNPGITTEKRTYNYSIDYECSVTVRLKPKKGFLGGNDVPLLDVGNAENISISHSGNTAENDDTAYIARNDVTDWANVEIDTSGLSVVLNKQRDPVVECGVQDNVQQKYLREEIKTPDMKDWTAAFVDFVPEKIINKKTGEEFNGFETISQDTVYTISAGLKPKIKDPSKAKVIAKAEEKTVSADVTAYVSYKVEYDLSGLTTNRDVPDVLILSELKDAYTAEITADKGYLLPKTVSVKGVPDGSAVIKNESGMITVSIPKESITGNIRISAAGVKMPHFVHYYYQVYDKDKDQMIIEEYHDTQAYYNGSTVRDISEELVSAGSLIYPTGYDKDKYEWTWPDGKIDDDGTITGGELTENGSRSKIIMGDEDLYVVGSYVKTVYTLTIKYVDDKGNKLHEPYISPQKTEYDPETDTFIYALTAGSSYYVRSPFIPDHAASDIVVSGTIDKDNPKSVNVTVTYSSNTNKMKVHYIKCDIEGNPIGEIAPKDGFTITNQNTYRIDVYKNGIDKNKYQLFKVTKIKDDVEYEQSDSDLNLDRYGFINLENLDRNEYHGYYLYYMPVIKQSTVTFDANNDNGLVLNDSGGTGRSAIRQVIVGREYGYNPITDSYGSLPKVVLSDYIFEGWYTSATGGTLVEEDTLVTNTANHTLYAHWKPSKVKITVHYLYASDNSKYKDDFVWEGSYNMGYSIKSPEPPDGYAADFPVISGVAVSDEEYTVLYSSTVKLVINVYNSSYAELSDFSRIPLLKGGTFELYRGDTRIAETENTEGRIEWIGLERGETYTIKCKSPPAGFDSYSDTVTIDNIVNEKNVFLEQRILLPFTGTTNQTIYYCVGAGIMLTAALLLYKTLKKEKQNDDN